MPQPRKYETDSERFRAYRERRKVKLLAADRALAVFADSAKKRRAPVPGSDALRGQLRDLRVEITRRRKAPGGSTLRDQWTLDWVEIELDRLLGIERPKGF